MLTHQHHADALASAGRSHDATVVECTAFKDQQPGTSGLRKKTAVFLQPNYLETYVQSVFNAMGGVQGKRLVLGGDGRFNNLPAIQDILRMAAANQAAEVIVGQNGLLSTPAASHLIRINHADGGLILSASHNPGGPNADFGVKFNVANGGPAPDDVTSAIFAQTRSIASYLTLNSPDLDLSALGEVYLSAMRVTVVDPVAEYAALMEQMFDFAKIRQMFSRGFTFRFDAMHAVTGPYATHIFQTVLGAPDGSVVNATPLEDFGQGHPDPNPIWAKKLVDAAMSETGPDFAAASDGDGDRNMILGRGVYVTPSDSLAVLAANIHLVPAYSGGLKGVARSMPTSRAVDRVAQEMGIPCFETPTGWKYFGNLLDAGQVTLCGEESAGTGSDHIREKDGLWAVLAWLNILAVRQQPVAEVLQQHWNRFGRHYYMRHDYEGVDAETGQLIIHKLTKGLSSVPGRTFAGLKVQGADNFSYLDPVKGLLCENKGIRFFFETGERAVIRLSGTGTDGATLRIYYEVYVAPAGKLDLEPQKAIRGLIAAVECIAGIGNGTGRTEPDVVV